MPGAFDSNERWNQIEVSGGELYEWDPSSTYIQEPPFLVDLTREPSADRADSAARVSWHCWAIPSRPITFRPPARSPKIVRPVAT